MENLEKSESQVGRYLAAREEIVDNFYRVRRALGVLGLLLPFLLLAIGFGFGKAEPSISDYYHTLLRDVYVGILTAIGVFLICYTGFRRDDTERFSDDLVTTVGWRCRFGCGLCSEQRNTQHLDGAGGSYAAHIWRMALRYNSSRCRVGLFAEHGLSVPLQICSNGQNF